MRWLRSWPAHPPEGRAHVVDDLERLVIDDYDYTPLAGVGEDVVVIEWDIAIDPGDAERFTDRCLERPDWPRVGAYRLHDDAGERWAHRRISGDQPSDERFVVPGDLFCDYFGFGLVYLPQALVRGFIVTPAPERGRPPWAPVYEDTRLTDQTFSTWLRWRRFPERWAPPTVPWVPIDWDLAVVHLHGRP